jgi:hypothetical protein
MRTAWLASGLCLISTLGYGKEPATLADLEVLLQKGASAELLERAEDVAPAARTDAWKALVTSAAVAMVKSTAVTKDPFAPALEADTLAKRHAFLAEREPFQRARDGAVLAGAQRCLKESDGEPCWKSLDAFEPTLSPQGGLELGRALRKNGARPERVAALYARAAAKDPGVCKDAEVADVLVASLDGPIEGAPQVAARSVAFSGCWAALMPKLKAAMVGASAYRLQNCCKPMREKKSLTSMQEDLCVDEGQ